jgi:hypothetical protein
MNYPHAMTHVRALLASSLAVASVAVLSAGCSSNATATPQAAMTEEILVGNNSSATCPVGGGDVWTIGDASGNPVKDGDTQTGAAVNVTCSVKAAGGGFDVTATAKIQGGGSLTVSGHFDGTTNDQKNITGTFVDVKGTLGTYVEKDCTASFLAGEGIATGRVRAELECPTATDSTKGYICDAHASFRFENCDQ